MLRKFALISALAVGSWGVASVRASADHGCFYPGGSYHSGYSSYRPSSLYYNSAYSSFGLPAYRHYSGYPIPSTFSRGYSSYFGGGYGSGYNAPFGGYGVSGFPRHVGGFPGPGVSIYFGR